MQTRNLFLITIQCLSGFVATQALIAGPYAPPAGQAGSEAYAASSEQFVGWATEVLDLTRGPMDIASPENGLASYGSGTNALGESGANGVVSLGDGGSITLGFDFALYDGEGDDFAVFENGFSATFLEFAFVEVSSDGVNFFRFEADYAPASENPSQIGGFGSVDTTEYNNLAGKYAAGYGTGFDLYELVDVDGLDINNIVAIRLVDVVGSLDPLLGSTDADGDYINDPYSTPFASSGFDLDAIGVMHQVPEPAQTALILGLGGLLASIWRRRRHNPRKTLPTASRIALGTTTLLVASALPKSAHASIDTLNGASASLYFANNTGDSLSAFNWGNDGSLYFSTSNSSYTNSTLWSYNGSSVSQVYNAPSNYGGSSVAKLGSYVYFNDSDIGGGQYIYKSNGSSSSTVSSHYNYYLHTQESVFNNTLWATGSADWTNTDILYATVDETGELTGGFPSIGSIPGGPGPMTFDAAGNLYYLPGYGDQSIYRWDASQVTAALSDPTNNALSGTGSLWYDWSSDFSAASGATGIAVDNAGNLVVTLTDFSNPAQVVYFEVDETGNTIASATTIGETDTRLGTVSYQDGQFYVADTDGIYVFNQVPEPSFFALSAGFAALTCIGLKRRNRAA